MHYNAPRSKNHATVTYIATATTKWNDSSGNVTSAEKDSGNAVAL